MSTNKEREWIDAAKLREALDWRDSKPSGDDYDGELYDRLRDLLTAADDLDRDR